MRVEGSEHVWLFGFRSWDSVCVSSFSCFDCVRSFSCLGLECVILVSQ